MVTAIEALYRQAEKYPDQVAFVAGSDSWTYQRLVTESERLARALLARGLKPGDRLAIHMANIPELVIAYYACFRIGAIATPLNIRFKTAELRALLQRLQPALYLGQAQLYPQVAQIETDILATERRFVAGGAVQDDRAQAWAGLLEGAGTASLLGHPDVNAPAVLLTTSGTTGLPKFVTHTPATLSVMVGAGRHLEIDGSHIIANALPMVHGAGMFTFLLGVEIGVPIILFERFDPEAVLDGIAAHRCSWMLGLPFMFAEMMKCQQAQRRVDSLRACFSGGDVCPVEMQRAWPDLFGTPLHSIWGATEAGILLHGRQPGPVCRVTPGTEVRLVDENGRPAPRGEVGELQIRSRSVTIGYWAGPGRIDDASVGGWFPTGDLIRQGEGDELWFVGRKKDLIIRGGSNISPVEVEQVLRSHPAVREAVVVGVPDQILGQRVAALVQLATRADGAVLRDILAYSRAQLADYKTPERLKVAPEIPRNALGKIDRRSVLALMSDERVNERVDAA